MLTRSGLAGHLPDSVMMGICTGFEINKLRDDFQDLYFHQ